MKGEDISGWFSLAECQKLYQMTMLSKGPILEIGHFMGKSTACICQGIFDSRRSREFNSYDLGFVSEAEFKSFYDKVHKTDVEIPELFSKVYKQGTTTTSLAKVNLSKIQLDKYVNLISGNFIDHDNNLYDLIFCDAVHEPHEIELNLPHIIKRSNQGCIWAFHDMSESNINLVLKLASVKLIDKADSLGVFLFIGQ